MKRKIIKFSSIYYIAEFLYVFGCVYAQTNFSVNIINIIVDMLQYLSIPILIFKLFYENRLSKKSFYVYLGLVCITLIICYASHNYAILLPTFMFMIAKEKNDDDNVIKCGLLAVATATSVTILLAFANVIDYNIDYAFDGRLRNALGFLYYTYAANYFFHIVIMYVFLKKRPINIKESLIILIINQFIYSCTQTRVVYYEVLLLLVICWSIKIFNISLSLKLSFFLKWSFVILAIFSFVISIKYDPTNNIMLYLNKLTSYRLSLSQQGLARYGFTLFGNDISFNSFSSTSSYDYVDSSYLNIFLQYGFVGLFLIIVGFTMLMSKYTKSGKFLSCIALLFLAIHSVTDPQLLSAGNHQFMFLLLSSTVVVEKKDKKKNISKILERKKYNV